jgi:hypothetical protein
VNEEKPKKINRGVKKRFLGFLWRVVVDVLLVIYLIFKLVAMLFESLLSGG